MPNSSALIKLYMLVFFTVVGAATPARGMQVGDSPLADRERLSGSWWGARPTTASRGLAIDAGNVSEYTAVVAGGLRQRGSFRNIFTLDAALDLEVFAGIGDATLAIQYQSATAERGGSRDAGEIQIFSNIETDRSLDTISELWYEQRLFDGRLRFKIGKVDANSEFNAVDAAGDFSHSSAGFSPAIFVFPSYPDPATSINLFATLLRSHSTTVSLAYGLYDGALGVDGVPTGRRGPSTFFSDTLSDDFFHIGEAALSWTRPEAASGAFGSGRLAVGGWYHTGAFERFDGGEDDGTLGFYATIEFALSRVDTATQAGVYGFAQYAAADEAVSEVAQHVGAGLVWRGVSPGRPGDSMGVYASAAILSDAPGAGFSSDELAIDCYYRVAITNAVFFQPEVQYIVNPSGDGITPDAWVIGGRIGVTF